MENSGSVQFNASEVLELIRQVDAHRLGQQKNVVMFLGNTGAGKSTLVHFLYGDENKLRVEEVGPGVYRIVDEDNRICHGIMSKTFLVDFIIDNEIAYYDCPGFNDTRNANYDMAGSYMLRKVLSGAEEVKFICVVNYASVGDGTNRDDFMNLLKHVSQFIKNMDNYEKSFSLIVSKVDNITRWNGENYVEVSQDEIKTTIAGVLQEIRDTIQHHPDSYAANNFGDVAIKILNVLLKQSNNRHENIELFTRPRSSGALSEMNNMKKRRDVIKAMITRLEFSKSNINDFAFSISEASINNIHLMIEAIDRSVMTFITEKCNKVKDTLIDRLVSLDYSNLNSTISDLSSKCDNTVRILQDATDMEHCMREFLNFLSTMQVKVNESQQREIDILSNFTKFLYTITNENDLVRDKFREWSREVENIKQFINENLSWNKLLRELYRNMSIYSIYNNCGEVRIYDEINESNMQTYMNLIKDKMPTLNNLLNIDIHINRILKIRDLNNFISVISEPAQNTYYEETGILTINAEFFFLSRLSAIASSYPDVKEIRIYAYNTIYFDIDIKKVGDELKISIIAPNWEIIGEREIILDGCAGSNHVQAKANKDEDGKPGEPGGPAGCFFGVFDNVTNGHLTISANGGKGGDGQQGGGWK